MKGKSLTESAMFDRSLLPDALLEFVVISDTHFMVDVGTQAPVEFASRRLQTARADHALGLVAALKPDFVVHLGDLVQEYPETPRFPEALQAALAQIRSHGLNPHFVAGNHDVGDKPDPTMPTQAVTERSLSYYHKHVGPSWYSFDRHDCHFVVLNSQIMNSDLVQTEQQRHWLERDLEDRRGKRLFVLLHLPPYLYGEHESAFGHYDNLDEPARSWLLALLRRHLAEILVAGHVHYRFYDRLGATRYYVMPSPSFTRPGFGHLFASPPPPEQGRDDAGKLGFYLFRVLAERTDVHFVRTGGEVDRTEVRSERAKKLLTNTSSSLPDSPLGVTLCRPLFSTVEVPLAWPSAIRQPVRNDYPFLSLLELGAKAVRVPYSDLADPNQSRRLAMLREEGLTVTATALWSPQVDLPELVERHRAQVDAWEVQLPGTTQPSSDCLQAIEHCRCAAGVSMGLCPVIPNEQVEGKQHRRTRWGFRREELEEFDEAMREHDGIDRVVVRIGPREHPWDCVQRLQAIAAHGHYRIDLLLPLSSLDDRENANRAAEALFATALLPQARLFVEPLIDLDRTMDVTAGLLDTRCNPRPAFHLLRCLNSLACSMTDMLKLGRVIQDDALRILTAESEDRQLALVVPQMPLKTIGSRRFDGILHMARDDRLHWYQLATGTVEEHRAEGIMKSTSQLRCDGPSLLST